MTDDEALETLFAMANVQDGYAKKATDPGLKVIHKANAKAQREIAATIKDLRVRLAAAEAERDAALAEVQRLREALAERHALHLEQVRITSEWIAERDAALARVEKLREALVKAANRIEWLAGLVLSDTAREIGGEWHGEARAALDEDARHG